LLLYFGRGTETHRKNVFSYSVGSVEKKRKIMKRILVPTNFSPTAERAFRFATDIARKTEGTVFLYHVYTPLESDIIYTEQRSKQYDTQTETELLKRLQRLKKKVMANETDLQVYTIVGRSPIINNILGFVEDNQVELIVIGTKGASVVKKIIVGSVAVRIIEKSDIPVLLIPEKFEWKEPEQIVFVTNYQKANKQALSLIVDLAKAYTSAVTVVHLLDPNWQFYDKQQVDFGKFAFAIKRTFYNCYLKFKELMENLQKEIKYDMLVMVRRKKCFLENLFVERFTEKMAYSE